jgi:pimeloyl-ACP methyl ester carboxylesterase
MTEGIFTEKQIVVGTRLVTYYITPPVPKSGVLLFLHGWGATSPLWFNSVEPLGKTHQLVLIDLPGFGKSQKPQTVWGLSDYSDFVIKFVGKLDLGSVTLVGHSFGGSIAINIAINEPKLVESLILVDSAGIRPKTAKKSALLIISKLVKPVFRPKFMQKIRKKLYSNIGSDYLGISGMEEIYKKIISEDLTAELSRINQKTHLIWGENDRETPLTDAELMQNRIKNSTLEIIPGAGHFPFLDKPEEFRSIISKALD